MRWVCACAVILCIGGCDSQVVNDAQEAKEDSQLLDEYNKKLAEGRASVEYESKKAEVRKSLAKLEQSAGDALRVAEQNEIERRSGFESAVCAAIRWIDQHASLDPRIGETMSQNADWYSGYRECESRGSTLSGLYSGAVEPHGQDQKLATLHALVDVVEQYRKARKVDSALTERTTKTSATASPSYRDHYDKVSSYFFTEAQGGGGSSGDTTANLGLNDEQRKLALQRYPMFPKGSRSKPRVRAVDRVSSE